MIIRWRWVVHSEQTSGETLWPCESIVWGLWMWNWRRKGKWESWFRECRIASEINWVREFKKLLQF